MLRGYNEDLQKIYIIAYVIQADVPLLLGLNTMKKREQWWILKVNNQYLDL